MHYLVNTVDVIVDIKATIWISHKTKIIMICYFSHLLLKESLSIFQ